MAKRINLLLLIVTLTIPFISTSSLLEGEFFKPQAVKKMRGNSFDYVVVGSSRGLTTVNTNLIDSAIGTKGYNASLDGQGINSWLIMLNHLIHNEIKFDTLFITFDVGAETTTEDSHSNNIYRWHSELNNDYVYSLIFQNYSFKFSGIFFNYWKNNKSLLSSDFFRIIRPEFRNKFDDNGNYTYPRTQRSENCTEKTKYYLNLDKSKQLQEIFNICNDHNIYPIIYIAPYKCVNVEIISESNYLHLNHSSKITDPNCFYDDIHVNSLGREKATLELINELMKESSNN